MPHHPSSMVQNKTVDDVVVTHATPNGKAVGTPAADMENNFKPRLAHDLSDPNVIRTDDILASEDVEFKNLMLPDFILCGLTAANFHRPSPIQLRSIPLLRLGLDLIVQSKAGTGKTLVIAMAALETVKFESKRLQVLVVAPTREIALQTKHFISVLCTDVPVRTEAFIGGISVKEDKKNLLGCQIAIGTPGRINSLIENGDMSLGNVRLYVLDEADKLMEKPLFSQVKSISKLLPPSKQTILCSATFLHPVKEYVMKHMKEPFWVSPEGATRLQEGNIAPQKMVPTVLVGVKQFFKEVPNHAQIVKKLRYKLEEILDILASHSFTQCIIFSNYQTRAETICHQLVSNGWPALSVRGQDEQSHRSATLTSFKERQCRVLLTTDVMSRGVDFRGVDLVINLDIPYDSSTYLHRMGRAGRFGSHGCVITLASTGEEVENFKKILADIDTCVVFSLPSELSLIKQEGTVHNIFFGQSLNCEGESIKEDESKSTTVNVSSEDLKSKSENVSSDTLELKTEIDCPKQPTPDIDSFISGELNSKIKGVVLEDLDSGRETISKQQGNSQREELKESHMSSHQSATALPQNLFCDKNRRQVAVENAKKHLSEALCNSETVYPTFHTFEELDTLCSNWSLVNKDRNLLASAPEAMTKSKDWLISADIVMTAANLDLQELREKALRKSKHCEDIKSQTSDESSEQPPTLKQKKTYAEPSKHKARKLSKKNPSSHQNEKRSHHHKSFADHEDSSHEWLWDNSSNLYYIWDTTYSCYHLYNPNLNCHFKWEPQKNQYFKWDEVSKTYVLWNCEFNRYEGTKSSSNLADKSRFVNENTSGCSSSELNENYLSWFTLWNKQLKQIHDQVYQAEYLKNMCSKFNKS